MNIHTKKSDAESYRISLEVYEIIHRINGDEFPLCPRCRASVEREYMNYCNACGQHLGWMNFQDAKIIKKL